tara:strand:- start:2813 stop:4534 length:1722 start_codon:yes stop_codon:yes gene_type:complete
MSYTLVPSELIVDGAITSAKLDTNISISGTLGVTGEVTLATHLNMGDNDKIKIGAGGDLEIYHDGSNSYIANSTGNIYIADTNGAVHIQAKLNEESIVATADGAVTLYHDNSAKLATASGGVTVTGTLTATTLAGTLSTAAQTNITSVGTLTGFTSTGIDDNADATAITIDSSENVGIGRTPVAYGSFTVLDLAGSSGAIQKLIHTGNTVEVQKYASSTLGAIGTATNHDFIITTNDTERVRIDSSGNCGIGMTPTHQLSVFGFDTATSINTGSVSSLPDTLGMFVSSTAHTQTAYGDLNIKARTDAGGFYGIGFFTASSNNTPALRVKIDSTGTASFKGVIDNELYSQFRSAGAGSTVSGYVGRGSSIVAGGTATDIGLGGGAGNIVFAAGGTTERMRIASNGQVMIARTSAVSSDIRLNMTADASVAAFGTENTGTGNNYIAIFRNSSGTLIGSIIANNGAVAFNTSSDYRLKENVDYTWDATTRLKQLKPARFNFISDETNTLVDGFLAHEVSSIVPEAITGEKDAVDSEGNPEYQGIDQSKLVPLLTKAIQEQQTIIDDLKTRIETLER